MTEPARRRADLQGAAASAAPVFACPKNPKPQKPSVLKKRADFLAASRARRQASRAFVLQARKRGLDDTSPQDALRIGYTCSKKVGNAVARNRAKRRLRAAAQAVLACHAQPGWDYVLVGRRDETAAIEFAQLCDDLRTALGKIHAPRPQKPQNA
ncbi:ribonuclease P protein component [Abyssibius alkaniclasticus]|nr:ribonuclease P protein component [Abyssibius alkaniclasticus]UPH72588.1 ribonuclease P protein component [Abyssibius alkaniclasticus]